MKALILPAGAYEKLSPLTEWMSEYLLPLVNKPILEHHIEQLVQQGITDISVVMRHRTYEVERYFGNGERWGAKIDYLLIKGDEPLTAILARLHSRLEGTVLCIPGNTLTDMDMEAFLSFHEAEQTEVTFAMNTEAENPTPPVSDVPVILGTASSFTPFIMGENTQARLASVASSGNRKDLFSILESQGISAPIYRAPFTLRVVSNLEDYMEINRVALEGGIRRIVFPANETQQGVWIGRHSRIHRDTKLVPPVLIGSHCSIRSRTTLGPYTILGNNVIVDTGATVLGSIVMGNTFVGAYTEIRDSVVRKNSLIKVPHLVKVFVGDDFILGDLSKPALTLKIERTLQYVVGGVLLLILSPVLFIGLAYHWLLPSRRYFVREERFGEWKIDDLVGTMKPKALELYAFRSRNRLIRKVPGLLNVLRGDLTLVGNAPLTKQEAESLTEEWELPRFMAPSGLFHLWEVGSEGMMTWEERVVAENYYAATRTLWTDMKILLRSLLPQKCD